jgi:hypothetical protein
MRPPSTRGQVLIVWTIVCGATFLALGAIAWAPPPRCFECGMGIWLAQTTQQALVVIWAVVAVLLWYWFARRG